jgi:hypothetical protein
VVTFCIAYDFYKNPNKGAYMDKTIIFANEITNLKN